MTMKEIRKAFNDKVRFSRATNDEIMAMYYSEVRAVIEKLYNDGIASDFSTDVLREINGYQMATGNYETFHVWQTFDLRSVEATDKATARDFAEWFLTC